MDFLLEGLLRAFALLLGGHAETWSAVAATLKVTAYALLASSLLGVPAGFMLGFSEFPGKRTLRLLSNTLMSLPTVLVGLIVYAFLSRRGPLGDLNLLFTLEGVAVGLTILATPILISLTASAIERQDPRLPLTLMTLGAGRVRLAASCLYEARFAVAVALVNAFGRVATEVGVAMMVGGNIKWDTRTIATAIALETGKGEFAMGMALGVVLLIIALAVNVGASALRRLDR